MSEVRNINVNKLDSIIDKINLIDIREEDEYEEKSLKYSKNIPMNELLENYDEYLDMDKEYYFICRSGRRSLMAAYQLAEEGYNIVNVSGGIEEYTGKNIN